MPGRAARAVAPRGADGRGPAGAGRPPVGVRVVPARRATCWPTSIASTSSTSATARASGRWSMRRAQMKVRSGSARPGAIAAAAAGRGRRRGVARLRRLRERRGLVVAASRAARPRWNRVRPSPRGRQRQRRRARRPGSPWPRPSPRPRRRRPRAPACWRGTRAPSARSAQRRAPTRARLSAAALLAEAGRARGEGQLDRAASLYRRLQREFPGTPEALVSTVPLGRLLLDGGSARAALAAFDGYLRGMPRGPAGRGGPLRQGARARVAGRRRRGAPDLGTPGHRPRGQRLRAARAAPPRRAQVKRRAARRGGDRAVRGAGTTVCAPGARAGSGAGRRRHGRRHRRRSRTRPRAWCRGSWAAARAGRASTSSTRPTCCATAATATPPPCARGWTSQSPRASASTSRPVRAIASWFATSICRGASTKSTAPRWPRCWNRRSARWSRTSAPG